MASNQTTNGANRMADDDSIESLFACQAESDADSAPRIISRKDAIALGFITYFTGKPCKHGHVAERRVDNRKCVCCRDEYNKSYRADHKEYKNVYIKQRGQVDIQFWLVGNLRSRLYKAIKNNQKSGSAVRDLGCSIEFLKQHLEAQFA